jgi:hypothetical protein
MGGGRVIFAYRRLDFYQYPHFASVVNPDLTGF